ncbi:MAG: class 1 fructose-bisphosphatase [Gammaproteobacteria bacterium]|nr:MAG: class 1 fructose-bisphosphatase [Gammaproteobacteria bacterium]
MQFGTTLTQYIIDEGRRHSAEHGATGAFTALLNDVATACKRVSSLVRLGEMAGVLGASDSENVQGEEQKKLDIIANDAFLHALEHNGLLAALASEEMDAHYPIPEGYPRGDYLLAFDPLDGSSNVDVNGVTGTIFSITHYENDAVPTDTDFLRKGREQVCAGYCVYSSATMLILTTGHGVVGFTLDSSIGEFILTHPDIRLPADTSEYAINAAYRRHWFEPVNRYIEECEAGREGPRGRNFNMRWAGSMVGDIHRILSQGGVFLYPDDRRLRAEGKAGKLRLLYEANPMGMLIEQAGGLASTGHEPILDIPPESLHQRVPVIMGTAAEVERLIAYHGEA